jgi:lysozyme
VTCLTANAVLVTAREEGLVQEAYLDSASPPNWTWAMGVTDASGHQVYPRYKDNPQPLQKCVDVSVWLLREKYLPPVVKAFEGRTLTESQLAAALSFQWNEGAILHAEWVKIFMAGKPVEARASLLANWSNGGALTDRRKREAALFFSGVWPSDWRVPIWGVAKPSYHPHGMTQVDIRPLVEKALANG